MKWFVWLIVFAQINPSPACWFCPGDVNPRTSTATPPPATGKKPRVSGCCSQPVPKAASCCAVKTTKPKCSGCAPRTLPVERPQPCGASPTQAPTRSCPQSGSGGCSSCCGASCQRPNYTAPERRGETRLRTVRVGWVAQVQDSASFPLITALPADPARHSLPTSHTERHASLSRWLK